jgi:hypothetical protein
VAFGACVPAAECAPALQQEQQRPPAIPQEAREGLDTLYGGNPDAAIQTFRKLQASQPDSPLGYLLEAEARWWKIYCSSLEFKDNEVDAWHRDSTQDDMVYLRLSDKATKLAEDSLKTKESTEMHLYAGMGYALRARLLGLRGDHRGTAKAGVKARKHFLEAKQLDPQLADADTGLGLYNYYVDTLSGFVKVLRPFMGIPGGKKKDGIAQLENGMEHGELTAVDARFYLAKDLRIYDKRFDRSAQLLEPLAAKYPQNPVFALFLANANALLNEKGKAQQEYRRAEAVRIPDAVCKSHIADLARQGLTAPAKTASASNH